MGSSPVQPTPPEATALLAAVQEQQLTIKESQNELQVAKSHYAELLAYFKHLVWLTGGALGLIILVGGYIFHSNLQDTLRDIQQKATQQAAEEAHKRVSEAFEEKNIKAEIAAVANDKIGKITDKMIEQQVTTKLQPFERRLLLIGRISECESTMRAGFRDGYDELTHILAETQDSEVIQFGKNTLERVARHYEVARTRNFERFGGASPQMKLQQLNALIGLGEPEALNLGDVVQIINTHRELNYVSGAFLAFREMTGDKDIKMFDFTAVKAWCAAHDPQCKPSGNLVLHQ